MKLEGKDEETKKTECQKIKQTMKHFQKCHKYIG